MKTFNILCIWLENVYSDPHNWSIEGFDHLIGENQQRDPQKAHPCAETRHMTCRSSRGRTHSVQSQVYSKSKKRKRSPKKPRHDDMSRVRPETTHVVAAPHGFACVVIPVT